LIHSSTLAAPDGARPGLRRGLLRRRRRRRVPSSPRSAHAHWVAVATLHSRSKPLLDESVVAKLAEQVARLPLERRLLAAAEPKGRERDEQLREQRSLWRGALRVDGLVGEAFNGHCHHEARELEVGSWC
jgi:hypothetical protein